MKGGDERILVKLKMEIKESKGIHWTEKSSEMRGSKGGIKGG